MSLRNHSLESLGEGHLLGLVTAGVIEGRTIEYKLALPGRSDADGKEFLSDVCSFANAGGGDLLYGVEEAGGVAVGVPGVNLMDPDAETLRLDSMIRSGIDPRLVGLRIQAVSLSGDSFVLVVRVPRSFNKPHAVDYKNRFRFYSRGAAGKFAMDVAEIRSLVVGSESLVERVRSFRADRLATIAANQGPSPLSGNGIAVLHALPLTAFEYPAPHVDLITAERNHWSLLKAGSLTGDAPRYNLDGLLRVGTAGAKGSQSYAQLFRSGAIELADAFALDNRAEGTSDTIPSIAFERYLLQALPGYLELQEKLGVNPPILVMLSLLGVKGYRMTVPAYRFDEGGPIDRQDLLLPDVLFEEFTTDAQEVAVQLHPALDALWNACGYQSSPNYDTDGTWVADRLR